MVVQKQVINLNTAKATSKCEGLMHLIKIEFLVNKKNEGVKNQLQIHAQLILQVCFDLFDSGHDPTNDSPSIHQHCCLKHGPCHFVSCWITSANMIIT